MNTAKRTDRIIIAVIAALIVAIAARLILGGGGQTAAPAVEAPAQVAYTDYNGKTIGILTGTNMEAETFKYFPASGRGSSPVPSTIPWWRRSCRNPKSTTSTATLI